MKKARVLVINNCANQYCGAERSLISFLEESSGKVGFFLVTFYIEKKSSLPNNVKTLDNFPFEWFVKLNTLKEYIRCIKKVFNGIIKLRIVIRRESVNVIYSNTVKSHVYGAFLRLCTKKKTIWHVRDNIQQGILSRFLTRQSDKIICISQHIYSQVNVPADKKVLIYGGIDTEYWRPGENRMMLKEELSLQKDTLIIAQISQITPWKRHQDFIKAAKILTRTYSNVHFLIIGEDISGNNQVYKTDLKKLVKEEGLSSYFSFLGHREDVRDIINEIDILVHPAINEPFGRVLIEAMAMEKPVVAYDCGGPKEIIIDEVTGCLAEPFDYSGLALRVSRLLWNINLREQFGQAGRRRVVNHFNIERYVNEMDDVFESV